MPHSRSSSIFGACTLPLIALVILGMAAIVFVPRLVTTRAESLFGPASQTISKSQHLVLSVTLLLNSNDLTDPVNPYGASIQFTIFSGESVPSITQRLAQAGLITNPNAFRSYLQYSGLDVSLQAGDYTLSPAMNAIQIAQEIQSSISEEVTLVILAGWRIEEVAASLPTSGFDLTPEEFFQATAQFPQGVSFSSELAANSYEGFLFPDSYTLSRQVSIDRLLATILMNFDNQVSTELRAGFSKNGLSLLEAVTLASIIEREAINEEEMPMLASVFYNRLAINQRLASDPTVQYAIGFNPSQNTWWTNPLSLSDLKIDSPYNTYLYPELPPGPICSPSLSAMRAVAFPAHTPYYYFRAACDGSGNHLFAETYEQHLANECP